MVVVVTCGSELVIEVEGSRVVEVLGKTRVDVVVLGKTIELVLAEVVPTWTIVLVDSEPEMVVPIIPPGQVIDPPTSVVQDSVLLLDSVVDNTDVMEVDDPLTPRVALAPPPAVAPPPPPAVPEAPAPISEEPVLTPAPALPPTETEALAVPDACAPTIVLLDDPVTPAPALAPIIPWPVRLVTTQAFSGSPPFVQMLADPLLVVIPAICDVMPLVLTDTVALIVALIVALTDGTEVLLNEFVFNDRLE